MKARFNYLEKLPQRLFETSKHSFGCPVSLQGDQESSAKTKELRKVLIVELIDVNEKMSHDEIKKRVELEKGENQKKQIISYIIDPQSPANIQEKVRQ